MPVRIVRLGSPRHPEEGLRIGTVRRPPRGVSKEDFAKRDYYDVWLPMPSPSAELVQEALSARSDKEWEAFRKKYVREMSEPDPSRVLDLLAAMSRQTAFSVGCYCEDENRCHRSVLRSLLADRGAIMKSED